jgi:hypothetical protein
MKSTRDSWGTDHRPRAADSAACLLVAGGYEEYAEVLRRVVAGVKQRILMSPALGDFFQIRFCDLGPRPSQPSRGTPEVARLVLELTSRPGDAARNFSAVLVFDQSAKVVEQMLRACASDPALHQLNARCLGMASRDDRPGGASARPCDPIAIARHGRRNVEEFVTEIHGLAERLLNDFGSGWKPGVRPEQVSRLGAVVEPAARGVIATATADEDARIVQRRAVRREEESLAAAGRMETGYGEAERRELAAQEAAAWQRELAAQRAEAELRAEAERLAAAKQQIAALEKEVAELRRGHDVPATPPGGDKLTAGQQFDLEPERPRDALPASGDVPVEPDADRMTAREQGDDDAPAVRPAGRWQRIKGKIRESARRELPSGVGTPQASGAADAGSVVNLLSECVERLRAEDLNGVRDRLPALRRYASSEIGSTDRLRCRAIVIEDRLLSPRLVLGTLAVEFYDVLLRLVYGQPLGYQQYCDLEYSLERSGEGALPPAPPLMRAVDRAYPSDPLVLAITRHYLSRYQGNERVRPHPGDVRRLIMALAEVPLATGHVDILYGILTQYLGDVRTSSERRETTGLLRDRAYLSAALSRSCPNAVPDQVAKLITLLRWAYREGLDRPAAEAVIGAGTATSALLTAMLYTLARPADRPWVIQKFLHEYHGRDIDMVQAAELEPDFMRLSTGGGGAAGE